MRLTWGEKQQATRMLPYRHTLEVNEGTPRSGKTTAGIARFANFIWQSPDENHLILAFNQEQAYKLVCDGDGLGLVHIFNGICKMRHNDYGDHLEIQTPAGVKRVYYKGGGKADSHKSFIGLSFGSVYFCEINLLHMDAIQEAFRRTFAAKYRWHIADLNPPAPNDPVIRQVFEVQDTLWQHWTIFDNPIITEERREEIRAVCEKNPYLYKRDWLGERCIPEGVIYSMFDPARHILSALPEGAIPVEMFFAGDGGLTDATSISCNIVAKYNGRHRLYRVANWYYDGGNKAMSVQARDIATRFAPYCRNKWRLRESCWKIDPACKALRKELELFGIVTDGADNNAHDIRGTSKGIRVGIEYLQSAMQEGLFFLVEDPEFGHYNFLQEIGLYCVDKHGQPVDAHNHALDEARYSSNLFYKNYVI